MSPTMEKRTLYTYGVQLKSHDGAAWPAAFTVQAHSICEPHEPGHTKGEFTFKRDGEIVGKVYAGQVAAGWIADQEKG